jgi:hypothetical protein
MSRSQAGTFDLDEGFGASHFREIADLSDVLRRWTRGTRGIYGRTLPTRSGKPREEERPTCTNTTQIRVVVHCLER